MTAGLSFAVVSQLVPDGAKNYVLGVGLLLLVVSCYQWIRIEMGKRAVKAKAETVPMNHDRFRVEGGKRFHPASSIRHLGAPVNYYRVRVTNRWNHTIDQCKGVVVSISRNGQVLFNHHDHELPFEHCTDSDATSKSLAPGETKWLDVLVAFGTSVDPGNFCHIAFGTKGAKFQQILTAAGDPVFSEEGAYEIQFLIRGKDEPFTNCSGGFVWSEDYTKSDLVVIHS